MTLAVEEGPDTNKLGEMEELQILSSGRKEIQLDETQLMVENSRLMLTSIHSSLFLVQSLYQEKTSENNILGVS